MKPNNFRDIDTADLAGQSTEAQEQLFRLRFQIGMGQTDGVKRYRELRKDRARMLGVLRERELDPAKAQAAAEAAKASKKKSSGKKKGK
jgi:large subunit ribosomal protein L29